MRRWVRAPRSMLGVVLALITCPSSIGIAAEPGGAADARIANAWQVLRTVDCARCHGKDYTGLSAPSIVQYAATQPRAMFDQIVLEGNPARGMPGYRSNAYVADNIDAIYEYFAARASGKIGADYRPPASN